MGADLYIHSIRQQFETKYRQQLDAAMNQGDACEIARLAGLMNATGHFRDAYNLSSVLRPLGLSWWGGVSPMLDAAYLLKGENLKQFRNMVSTAKFKLPTIAEFRQAGVRLKKRGPRSRAGWRRHYVMGRAELVAFLDQAIALNTSVHCSL